MGLSQCRQKAACTVLVQRIAFYASPTRPRLQAQATLPLSSRPGRGLCERRSCNQNRVVAVPAHILRLAAFRGQVRGFIDRLPDLDTGDPPSFASGAWALPMQVSGAACTVIGVVSVGDAVTPTVSASLSVTGSTATAPSFSSAKSRTSWGGARVGRIHPQPRIGFDIAKGRIPTDGLSTDAAGSTGLRPFAEERYRSVTGNAAPAG